MTEVTSSGKFDTAFGMAFVIQNPPTLKVGQTISIDGTAYQIKRLMILSRPSKEELIAVFVSR